MGRSMFRPVGFVVLFAAIAAPAFGQGSSVYTHSACVSARGGAGVASVCGDASGIYYNPGALAMMPSALSAGFTAIHNYGSFTFDTGTEVEREATTPLVPHGYTSLRLGAQDRLAVGFGVWAPYGLRIEWPEDFEGRFISWKTELRGLYLQPTLAYQVVPGRLSIGGGPQIVISRLELNQNVDARAVNPTLPPGIDLAAGNLEGTGTGVGAHIGLFYRVSERLSFGARYMHSVKVDLSGDATFEQLLPDPNLAPLFQAPGPFAAQAVEAELTFPPQAVVGIRFEATPALALLADYQWTGWSTFDQIEPEFEYLEMPPLVLNYKDAHTFRVGSSYMASPDLALRLGFIYNTAATPDETVTPILPEAERQLFTVGLGYNFGPIQADVMYNFVNQADRRGRVWSVGAQGETGEALNVGEYDAGAHLFGITLTYGLAGIR
jgi:long-chain fatty acid transport protein